MTSPFAETAILLRASALTSIQTYAKESDDGRETGGILLGRDPLNGPLEVLHAGDAGPDAVRDARFFLRDLGHAQRLASQAFDKDGSMWIGEWHTHPVEEAVPSDRDLATYQSLLADPELAFTRFLALIVGHCVVDGQLEKVLAGWICTPGFAELVPMRCVADRAIADGDATPQLPTSGT